MDQKKKQKQKPKNTKWNKNRYEENASSKTRQKTGKPKFKLFVIVKYPE